MKRLLLVGLDCADPDLLAELLPELPTLREVVENGGFSRLRSVDPPITLPAWMCMMTGKDPGQLGVYGFRNRGDHSYNRLQITDASAFAGHSTLWDDLATHGMRSVLIGVPGTYPPRPVAGAMISGLLTPNSRTAYTYPLGLKQEIEHRFGEYLFDAVMSPQMSRPAYLQAVRAMTTQRFAVARHLLATRAWEFCAVVEMGPDRMHHAFWADHDPSHPLHPAKRPFQDAIRNYYRFLDARLGELFEGLPSGTKVLIVSDHGVQPVEGGIAVNEWLMQQGYLTLTESPPYPTPIEDLIEDGRVDWARTRAWGMGGYYARIFVNVEGREPRGIVPKAEYASLQHEIAQRAKDICDEGERGLGTTVLRPATTYREVQGVPPDLLIYFGGLRWRSIGTIGWERIHLRGQDAGPGTANHALEGVFLTTANPGEKPLPSSLLDVRRFVLEEFGISLRNHREQGSR